jgi:arginyl-tRNA synthetase
MDYPLLEAKKEIMNILTDALIKLKYKSEIKLEIPDNYKADFSFPCFNIAQVEKKPPDFIAKNIIQIINKKIIFLKSIEQKGGYINFILNKEILTNLTLKLLIEKKNKYGFLKIKNKKVILEHTSANPNGPLHVGRARNPIIGDTLVRIYKAAGFNVESQFYLDDLGKQVAILTWGIKNINKDKIKKNIKKKDHFYVEYYKLANDLMNENSKISDEINNIIKKSENCDEETLDEVYSAYYPILQGIKESLKTINIKIDKYIPESTFIKDNSAFNLIDDLKKLDYLKKDGTSYYIDLKKFGISGRNTKFFLTRKDGTTLYATRDIAYHIWKSNEAEILINVLGEDHKLESKQVEIILNLLKIKNLPIPIFYSFVSMPGGKMSTRKGRVVYLDDLIEQCIKRAFNEVKKRRGNELSIQKMKKIAKIIGLGAIRYNIIKVQPEKDIIFNWNDALNFEGNSAPFIQYSHARACGILSKIKDIDLNLTENNFLFNKSEYDLIKSLAEFPMIIQDSYRNNKPHLLPNYLFKLASNFNKFYRDCPVISEKNEDIRNSRIKLVYGAKIVIKNGLDLLGIESPKEM